MMNELKRILLAEDNPNDVELTLAALAEHNLANEVVVVSDGAEALDYLYCRGKFKMRSDNQPAVVLLDLKMPKMDGLEVLRTIKKDDHLKTLPVVMLTSSREERDLVESYRLGEFVLIKGEQVVDFYSSLSQAFDEGHQTVWP
jgi:CheY-like chemotaxis protein